MKAIIQAIKSFINLNKEINLLFKEMDEMREKAENKQGSRKSKYKRNLKYR